MKRAFVVIAFVACQGSEHARPAPAGSAAPPVTQPQPGSGAGAHAMPPPLPSPLPGARKDITKLAGEPVRVAILDRQVVLADATRLRVIDTNSHEVASAAIDTGVQVLVAGEHELYVGTGISREHHDAKARIAMYKVAGAGLVDETILAPTTERNEVVAIVPGPEDVLLAYYDSKYNVTSVLAKRASVGWQTTPVAQLRMATSYARGDIDDDGKPELVIGRVYGDAKGVDGDAFVLAPDGKRTPIPTTRGVRSLAITGGDLFVGDGWHQNYAQLGHGLLTQVRHTPTGFRSLLVEDSPGQYAIEKILPARINGKAVLVTLGSHFVRVYAYDANKWKALTIAGASADVAVGDLDGEPGDEIVIVGKTTEVVSLVDVL